MSTMTARKKQRNKNLLKKSVSSVLLRDLIKAGDVLATRRDDVEFSSGNSMDNIPKEDFCFMYSVVCKH